MAIKFGDEHFNIDKGTCGVYKMIVNEKWFYIGSSVDLKRRLGTWKHYFNANTYRKNRSIAFILPQVESVRFEIIELVADGGDPKIKEDTVIKQNFDDELCLNLVPGAISTKGRKLPYGVVRKVKPKLGLPTAKKPVAQFDLSGTLIKIHESINEASIATGVKEDTIRKIFNGKGIRPRKYYFKPVDGNGDIVDTKYPMKLSPQEVNFICDNYFKIGCANLSRRFSIKETRIREIARGKMYKNVVRSTIIPNGVVPKNKPVIVTDLTGIEVGRYDSTRKAAAATKNRLGAVQYVLKGERKQSKGFIFKYA